MISLCGYNLCEDLNSLDPMVTNIKNITNVKIENGIYDGMDITRDTTTPYSTILPDWNYNTILDCNFNGNIAGGNVNMLLSQLDSVKIKRRKKGAFNWVTLYDIPIKTYDDLTFAKTDCYVPSGEEFEWAIVPIIEGAEGNYIINSLTTKFDGIFISDADTIFKLYSGTAYPNNTSNQSVGMVQPFNSKYPTVIINGATDYQNLSVQGDLLGNDYESTRQIDRNDIVRQRDVFDKFIKNGKCKIIRDWNGNVWLVIVTSGITYSYNSSYGMGIPTASFDTVEQGEYDNQSDLYYNGLVEVIE